MIETRLRDRGDDYKRSSTIEMKKGRINLLSFEGDEEKIKTPEFGFGFGSGSGSSSRNQNIKRSFITKNEKKAEVDFSQIRDRVIQMDFDEEIILEGDSAEAFLSRNLNEKNDNFNSGEDEELKLVERIKEAKLKRSLKDFDHRDQELPDFIPITTKGEYWLDRDTRESEETFNSTTSRLVRENLFNETEINDGNEGFTQFFGKDVLGRQGMMMTSKILERDIKSELYDLELNVNVEQLNDDEETISDVMWEKSQVLKGIEKGWNQGEGNNNFLSIQTKLSTFIPPKSLNYFNSSNNNNFDLDLKINNEELKKFGENVEKISSDSKQLEERINELRIEIENSHLFIQKLNEMETFFVRYSRFLSEKIPQLQSLEQEFINLNLSETETTGRHCKWESFFDNVDCDLLDLPGIIKKYKMIIKTNYSPEHKNLIELTSLFVRYHFLSINNDDDTKDIWKIYEESGLSAALKLLNTEQQSNLDLQLLDAIFEEIEINNGNGNGNEQQNFDRIKRIRNEILIKISK